MLRNQSILKFLGLNVQGDLGPWTFYTSKRRGLVFFQKSPPLEPPSFLQTHQRNKFRLVGLLWSYLSPEQKDQWEQASKRDSCKCHGYNLFTYWVTTGDDAAIETIQHATGTDLIPLNTNTP